MMRLILVLCLTVGLAFTAGTTSAAPKAAGPSKAEKPKKPDPRVGTLMKVTEGRLVVRTYGKVVVDIAVPINAKTQYWLEGKAATLAQLKPGMQLVITPETGMAQKVMAQKIGKKKKKGEDESPASADVGKAS